MQNFQGRKNHRGKGKGLKRGRKQAILMPEGDWEWGGCGDNVHFGYRKSRDFMDSRPSGRHGDIKTLVRLHNNDAGRLVSLHTHFYKYLIIMQRTFFFKYRP